MTEAREEHHKMNVNEELQKDPNAESDALSERSAKAREWHEEPKKITKVTVTMEIKNMQANAPSRGQESISEGMCIDIDAVLNSEGEDDGMIFMSPPENADRGKRTSQSNTRLITEGELKVDDKSVVLTWMDDRGGDAAVIYSVSYLRDDPGLITWQQIQRTRMLAIMASLVGMRLPTLTLTLEQGRRYVCICGDVRDGFELTTITHKLDNSLLSRRRMLIDYTIGMKGAAVERTKILIKYRPISES